MKRLFKISLNIIFDILNGIYSGFPICCILNYVRLQWKGFPPAEEMNGLYGDDDLEVQYVRCLRCRKRDHRVKIRAGRLPDYLYRDL